jgi:xylose dehydrogenase (NAD/NADP)
MRLALVGASSIASKIMPAIRASKFEIAGVSSQDANRGAEFAKSHGLNHLGTRELACSDPSIAAVYVSTSNSDHEACIETALLAGKHVLCEKPIVLQSKTAARLFHLAAERRLVLMEGLMYRFHPEIKTLLSLVNSGNYGSPRRINATFSFDYGRGDHYQRRIQSGGGALPDLGIYLIDFVHQIAASKKAVRVQTIGPCSTDAFAAFICFEDGLFAEIRASMNAPSLNLWEVVCEKASICVERYQPHEEGATRVRVVDEESRIREVEVASSGSGMEQFLAQLNHFHDAIRGKAAPFITAPESIRNLEILEKISAFDS